MKRKTLAAAVAALALAGLAGTTQAGAVPNTVSGDGGNRIGTLRVNGDAFVKEGGLSATWVKESDKVKELELSGNRIGVVTGDGVAWVKEGGLSASWVRESDN